MERRTFLAACTSAGLAGCAEPFGGRPAQPPVGTTAGTPAGETRTASSSTGSAAATRTAIHRGYETVEVRATTPDGTVLGSVTAAVADTPELRYTGLSDTESLPADRGMLFVYDEVGDHTFVMREMDFGIDIVYADDEKRITTIHHAPEPGPTEDGENQRYPGRGQYVLEVNYRWTTDHGVTEGDLLAFDL